MIEQGASWAFVDKLIKTLQRIEFICVRAQRHYIEEKDIEDILELVKGTLYKNSNYEK